LSFLSRLFGTTSDPRESLVPMWHRVIELSRTRAFYADHMVEDSVDGRFDMVTTMLAATMLRMEQSPALASQCALITELFVEDMDGQLRESGVGDVVVGKHMGKLMSALGGRIGALRDAFAAADNAALVDVLRRNVHWHGDGDASGLADSLRAYHAQLAALPDADLLAGKIPA
jgi:cytochrome b pre-mRNA-processing protein 3